MINNSVCHLEKIKKLSAKEAGCFRENFNTKEYFYESSKLDIFLCHCIKCGGPYLGVFLEVDYSGGDDYWNFYVPVTENEIVLLRKDKREWVGILGSKPHLVWHPSGEVFWAAGLRTEVLLAGVGIFRKPESPVIEGVISIGAACQVCGGKLQEMQLHCINEYDEEDDIVWQKCTKCFNSFHRGVLVSGGLLPIPDMTLVSAKTGRHRCNKCGAPYYKIPISEILNRDGKQWHVPYFAGPVCLKCEILTSLQKRYLKEWHIDSTFPLESTRIADGKPVSKFCYDPKNNLLLFAREQECHKNVIEREIGNIKTNLNHFVRGVYFREKKVIYLKMHKDQSTLYATEQMLKFLGMPKYVSVIWGPQTKEAFK